LLTLATSDIKGFLQAAQVTFGQSSMSQTATHVLSYEVTLSCVFEFVDIQAAKELISVF
jgi:hypothetical protein